MKSARPLAYPPLPVFAPALAWFQFSLKLGETLWASSQVIAHRTELMRQAGATPSPGDLKEMHRMGAEKVTAFTQASQRMATGLTAIGPGAWLALWAGPRSAPGMAKKLTQLSTRALAPIHSTATANARRLNAKKRRVR